ncbi:hypothetical protein M4I32_10930 [Microbacterium sp. LRZ72]|uniref:hypothetical protein n=1 Tax=Microbacterium sp. LRZ72 TaxID=2942481 RepID=UPI0029B1DE6D|nr:hypothetical protein [Microbacterium sp. LRZ72]MDX2377312.1 hypothetical protein [Microbacterium sp. LRZ72]
MRDPSSEPSPPYRRRRDRRTPDATDWSNQASLQTGSVRRWLIPGSILAVIAIALFAFALTLQLVVPILGLALVVVLWVLMFVVARRPGDAPSRNRTLAWLMGSMALGSLLLVLVLYWLEASAARETVGALA